MGPDYQHLWNWTTRKRKKRNIDAFEQVILTVGTQYKMIASSIITENPYAAESPYLESSLENVMQIYSSVDMMTGDWAFLSRENTSAIAFAGAIPLLYPRKNVTLRAKGHPAWKHMLYQFLEDTQTWLRQYHQRSISESVNSAFHRMFSRKLTRRARSRRRTETLVRICDFNIKRFCYPNQLKPRLFRDQNPLNWFLAQSQLQEYFVLHPENQKTVKGEFKEYENEPQWESNRLCIDPLFCSPLCLHVLG